MPDLVARLSGLHATLSSRLALQETLLTLSGRLDMVLSQIEMRSSAAPATLAPRKAAQPVGKRVTRYVEGESADEDERMDVEVEVDSGDDDASVEDVELGGDTADEEGSDEDEEDSEGDSANEFIDDEAEEEYSEDEESEDEEGEEGAGSGEEQDDGEDEDEDEDAGTAKAGPSEDVVIPVDELSDEDMLDEDAQPRQKVEIDNKVRGSYSRGECKDDSNRKCQYPRQIAMERIRSTIALDPSLPWTDTLTVTYPESIDVDVEDDLNRELALYVVLPRVSDGSV